MADNLPFPSSPSAGGSRGVDFIANVTGTQSSRGSGPDVGKPPTEQPNAKPRLNPDSIPSGGTTPFGPGTDNPSRDGVTSTKPPYRIKGG